MGLIRHELGKLFRKKFFLFLLILLPAANLATFYIYEQYSSRFQYIYEQRDAYERYLDGDSSADAAGYYEMDVQAQEAYLDSYPAFIDEMEARAERMRGLSIFMEEDSYVYRNLEKTCRDYAPFSGIDLQADNNYGLRAYTGYDYSIVFFLVFLAVLSWFIIFRERAANLLLLYKSSRKGHLPLGAAKLAAMLIGSALYILLQECSLIIMIGAMYGYGDPGRWIQSVSLFRNCTYMVTVWEGLAGSVLIKGGIALVLTALVFFISTAFRNEILAVLTAAAVFGAEYLFRLTLSATGTLSWLKIVNPFYYWNMASALDYYNLNLFGYPVGKDLCALIALILFTAVFSAGGLFCFSHRYQIRSESRAEALMQLLRSRIHFLGNHTGLIRHELYKVMIQQKRAILFAILLIWGAAECAAVFGPDYYSEPEEASYHYYAGQLAGPVTDETFAFVENESRIMDERYEELAELSNAVTDEERLRSSELQVWLERMSGGFYMIQDQLNMLADSPGEVTDKYFMDELAYTDLWTDYRSDILIWFAAAVSILFLVCGIYPLEEKKGIQSLLSSTLRGRRKLRRCKNICALLCTGGVILAAELPFFLEYYKIDHFAYAGQRLCDFTTAAFSTEAALGWMIAAVFLFKALSLLAVCLAGLALSRALKNEILAMATGAGAAGIIALILLRFGIDFEMAFILLF